MPLQQQYAPQSSFVYTAPSTPSNTTIDVEGAGPAQGVRPDILQGSLPPTNTPTAPASMGPGPPDVQFFGGGRPTVGKLEFVASNVVGRDMGVASQSQEQHVPSTHCHEQQPLQSVTAYSAPGISETNRSRTRNSLVHTMIAPPLEQATSSMARQEQIAKVSGPGGAGRETYTSPTPVKR